MRNAEYFGHRQCGPHCHTSPVWAVWGQSLEKVVAPRTLGPSLDEASQLLDRRPAAAAKVTKPEQKVTDNSSGQTHACKGAGWRLVEEQFGMPCFSILLPGGMRGGGTVSQGHSLGADCWFCDVLLQLQLN